MGRYDIADKHSTRTHEPLSQSAGGRSKRQRKRVYFVGAGLSAGLYYPVGRTLLRELYQYLQGMRPRQCPAGFRHSLVRRKQLERGAQIASVMRKMLRAYFAATPRDLSDLDVAEFFSVAHALSQSPWLSRVSRKPGEPLAPETPSYTTLFRDLAAAARSYFFDLCSAQDATADIRSLVRGLDSRKHYIVNFNWDEELDYAVQRQHATLSYTRGAAVAERGVLMLKPHGSVGWYDVAQGVANDGAYFIADKDPRISRARRRIVAYYENELPLDIDSRFHSPLVCPPLIMAPTFFKTFDYVEQQQIWEDVIEVCSNADEFVFLGYAMPRDDFLTRAAIRSALAGRFASAALRCLVVDCAFAEEQEQNFRSVFGSTFRTQRNWFEWRFGSNRKSFAQALESKLLDAAL